MSTLNGDLLPCGWAEAQLGVILPLQYGKALREDDRDDTGSFTVYGSSGPVGKHSIALTKGASIIVGRKGNVGATYYSPDACWPIDTVYFAGGTPSTNLRFFSYLLTWLGLVRLDRSTAVPGLSRDDYSPLRVPVPPANEQRRIVEAIDSHLTKLDAAVAALERVCANLKRYRASVLKAAVEGRLVPTEAGLAREEGRDFEPASVLLDRILAERRRRWEESELARMKAAGKPPKDGHWKSKYKEPIAPDTSALPQLPAGWCWATGDQVFVAVTSGSRGWAKYYSDAGALFLRMGNLDRDTIALDLRELQHVRPPTGAEGTRTLVESGDILISITAELGMVAFVKNDIGEAYINQHLCLARPVGAINRAFLAWYITSEPGRQRLGRGKRGATKLGLGLDDIRRLPIPLPPLAEQDRILAEIDEITSVADFTQAGVDKSVRTTDRLRQSILKWAFKGKLVDQDPNDEPACVLLERIRAERATTTPTAKSRKTNAHQIEAAK
ncbi:MAG: restriction endonuclease subunit S [Candidatus Binataceae bacterium]